MIRAKFNYPSCFTTLPEYTAHAGQVVEILRPVPDSEYDSESGETMYRVRAADGWEGDAWESELEVVR